MIGLPVKHLLGAETGSVATDTVEVASPAGLFSMEEDGLVAVTGPLHAKAHILRVEGGFQVELHDLRVRVTVECHTCLQTYEQDIHLPKSGSVFFSLPSAEDEGDFPVDVTKARLVLDDWLRQEVLMALPIMQKCSRSSCVMPDLGGDGQIRPFARLKDMFQ